jgi:hypothetical protein
MRLFRLRSRLALWIAPWLMPEPVTEEYDLPAYTITTHTTTAGTSHAIWRRSDWEQTG